jgi:hypothetical protein
MVVPSTVETGQQHFPTIHGGIKLSIAIDIGVDHQVGRHGHDDLIVDHGDPHGAA